ncbi:MAG: hypothetical protein CMN74_03975, partial [Sphingorhabdus sp.]|nr:hypothetical protein [Sphingorhabdus sp.]
ALAILRISLDLRAGERGWPFGRPFLSSFDEMTPSVVVSRGGKMKMAAIAKEQSPPTLILPTDPAFNRDWP